MQISRNISLDRKAVTLLYNEGVNYLESNWQTYSPDVVIGILSLFCASVFSERSN